MFGDSEVSTTFAAANTGVAQLVEHRSPKPGVGSSSLSSRAEIFRFRSDEFRTKLIIVTVSGKDSDGIQQ